MGVFVTKMKVNFLRINFLALILVESSVSYSFCINFGLSYQRQFLQFCIQYLHTYTLLIKFFWLWAPQNGHILFENST